MPISPIQGASRPVRTEALQQSANAGGVVGRLGERRVARAKGGSEHLAPKSLAHSRTMHAGKPLNRRTSANPFVDKRIEHSKRQGAVDSGLPPVREGPPLPSRPTSKTWTPISRASYVQARYERQIGQAQDRAANVRQSEPQQPRRDALPTATEPTYVNQPGPDRTGRRSAATEHTYVNTQAPPVPQRSRRATAAPRPPGTATA